VSGRVGGCPHDRLRRKCLSGLLPCSEHAASGGAHLQDPWLVARAGRERRVRMLDGVEWQTLVLEAQPACRMITIIGASGLTPWYH